MGKVSRKWDSKTIDSIYKENILKLHLFNSFSKAQQNQFGTTNKNKNQQLTTRIKCILRCSILLFINHICTHHNIFRIEIFNTR